MEGRGLHPTLQIPGGYGSEFAGAWRLPGVNKAGFIDADVFVAAAREAEQGKFDALPRQVLAGKAVLPLVAGGTMAHALVIDCALSPVLAALEATEVVHGHFLLDGFVSLTDGRAVFEPEAGRALRRAAERFARALDTRKAAAEPVHPGH